MGKAKTAEVAMVKVPLQYEGLDLYAERDGNILGNRKSFIAQVPVRGRSLSQNSLWAVWYNQIGKEMGQTPAEVKAECKLNYGVPILQAEDEGFRRIWAAKFANDTYEQQLYMMKYLPVTSLFNKMQGSVYTETLQREYSKQHIILDVL